MKISQEKFERLLKFLDAEMNAVEIASFEREVQSDADLKEQLAFQLNLTDAFSKKKSMDAELIDPAELNNLKALLATAKNNYFKNKSAANISEQHTKVVSINDHRYNKQVHFPHWLAAASVVVLAILASMMLYFSIHNNSKEFTADKHDSNYPKKTNDIVILPVDTLKQQDQKLPGKINYASLAEKIYTKDKAPSDPPQLLAAELSDYNSGSYETIQSFDAVNIPKTRGALDVIEIKQLAHYYKGISFFETKNSKAAHEHFQWVIDSSKNNQLQIKASWYKSLLYLKSGELKKAEPLLNKVALNNTVPIYAKKASDLLNTIKQSL